MKTVFKYYVVDSAAEQVIGVFESPSDVYAQKCLVQGLKPSFEKKLLDPADVIVYRCDVPCLLFETADELMINLPDSDVSVSKVYDLSSDFRKIFKESLKDEK